MEESQLKSLLCQIIYLAGNVQLVEKYSTPLAMRFISTKMNAVPDGFKNFAERPLRIMRKEIKGDPIQSSEYDDPGARTVRPYN